MTPAPVTPRRVVVTGLGVACALGLDPETLWRRPARRRVWHQPPGPEPRGGGAARDDCRRHSDDALAAAMRSHHPRERDRNSQLALYVAERALADAGRPTDGAADRHGRDRRERPRQRGIHQRERGGVRARGYRKLRPTTVVRAMFNRPAHLVSIRYRLTGASHVVSCACASGSIAVGEAFHRSVSGIADQVLAACCDTGLDPATFAAWNRLGVLSRIADPEGASRPFDDGRDGLVIGEARPPSCSSPSTPRGRGARAYAEVVGYGASSDAAHIVQPEAEGQARAIAKALAMAELSPSTSTTSMPTGRPPSSRIPWRRPRCAWCSAPTPTGYRSPPPRPSSVI